MPWAKPGQLGPYLTLGGPNSIRLLPLPHLLFIGGERVFRQDGAHTYGKGDPIDERKDDEESGLQNDEGVIHETG